MEVWFYISGSVVAKSRTGVVPPVGSEVTIRMETYKKGLKPGTILTFTVSEELPPQYDYTADIVYVDVNEWKVHECREGVGD